MPFPFEKTVCYFFVSLKVGLKEILHFDEVQFIRVFSSYCLYFLMSNLGNLYSQDHKDLLLFFLLEIL